MPYRRDRGGLIHHRQQMPAEQITQTFCMRGITSEVSSERLKDMG
jgi:hypothetical protein